MPARFAARRFLGRTLLSETRAYISAMTVRPPDDLINLLDDTFRAYKAQGIWPLVGNRAFFCMHDAQAATINIVNPSGTKWTPTSSPTWAKYRGYTGDGTASYVTSGVNWSAIPGVTQNDAHASVWALTAGTAGKSTVGLVTGSQVVIRTNGPGVALRLNAATLSTIADGGTVGFVAINRRNDASNQISSRNGGAETSSAAASSAAGSGALTILNQAASTFSDQQVAMASAGASLTAGQTVADYQITYNLLHRLQSPAV